MSRFLATPAYPDKMPVDISAVFAAEKPAGKHGFCRADGDDLRFEDGTLTRFWDVNLNGSEGYPVGKLAVKFENGAITFTVGDKWPASYYLIAAE